MRESSYVHSEDIAWYSEVTYDQTKTKLAKPSMMISEAKLFTLSDIAGLLPTIHMKKHYDLYGCRIFFSYY